MDMRYICVPALRNIFLHSLNITHKSQRMHDPKIFMSSLDQTFRLSLAAIHHTLHHYNDIIGGAVRLLQGNTTATA